jgi:hypothetical protein
LKEWKAQQEQLQGKQEQWLLIIPPRWILWKEGKCDKGSSNKGKSGGHYSF